MVDKYAELLSICDALTDAGVPAAVDPRDMNPPGAFVHLGAWDYDRLQAGTVTATIYIDLVAPDAGTPAALAQLDALEAGTIAALGDPPGPVLATTLTLPDSSAVLPCYRLTYLYELT